MIRDRDEVHRRYGRLNRPDNLDALEADDFTGFLYYENNRHWWGIHRHRSRLVSDVGRLRHGLGVLTDEGIPIAERLSWLLPANGPRPVPGLGKAVATPILHVVYPDRCGIWNSIAESAMNRLDLWPTFRQGSRFGDKYVAVNGALRTCSQELGIDLWTLDSLW